MKNTLLIFCLAMFMVSCEKADHEKLYPEDTSLQSIATEESDSTDTLKTNIGAEGWGETVNVKF